MKDSYANMALEGGYTYGILLHRGNPEYADPKWTIPPLVVAMHSGPTWQEGPGVDMRRPFRTS
jgi:hypothetical protein